MIRVPSTMARSMLSGLAVVLISCPSLPAADRIHFADPAREPLDGEITSFLEAGIVVKSTVTLSGGQQASSTEQIPWVAVEYLEYAPLPGEEAILADPAAATQADLQEFWLAKLPHLKRPRSNAGDIGLLFAERLLASQSEYPWERAMEIFARIERDDWNIANHARAKQGRLRTLIALDRIPEAIREAIQMAAESNDPVILLESKYVLATAAFDQLRDLETEHPRWMEDDEVRPKREAFLNEALDLFLYAYLFYGSEEPAAARGLVGAARVHLFAHDAVNARNCAGDVVRLYPGTSYRPEADRLLREVERLEPAIPSPPVSVP